MQRGNLPLFRLRLPTREIDRHKVECHTDFPLPVTTEQFGKPKLC